MQMKRIEQVTKTIRTDFDYAGKIKKSALKRQTVRENKEIMFKMLFKHQLK